MTDRSGVLGVLREYVGHDCPPNVERATELVAELIAAVVENREATQAFANDGMPANFIRYQESEKRLTAALKACLGGV